RRTRTVATARAAPARAATAVASQALPRAAIEDLAEEFSERQGEYRQPSLHGVPAFACLAARTIARIASSTSIRSWRCVHKNPASFRNVLIDAPAISARDRLSSPRL